MRAVVAAIGVLTATLGGAGGAFAQPVLRGATLPEARTVALDATATAFFTVLNTGDADATNCSVVPSMTTGTDIAEFDITSQMVVSGSATGPQNPIFAVPASGQVDFVVGISRNPAFSFNTIAYVDFRVDCDGSHSSLVWPDVNRVTVQFQDNAPDIIMIADTVTRDGIANINGNRRALVAVAAINIGAGDPSSMDPAGTAANEASMRTRATAGDRTSSPITTVSVCRLEDDGTCQAGFNSCSTSGFSTCDTAPVGDSPTTFAFVFEAPDGAGMPFAPNTSQYVPTLSWSNGSSTASTRVAIGGFAPAGAYADPHPMSGQFTAEFRNTNDPSGATINLGQLAFNPDGTGTGTLVRPVDRGAFTELVEQGIEFDWGPPCGNPCAVPDNGFGLTNVILLDTRQGDGTRPNDYYEITGDRLSCSLQPFTGGRCVATDGPGEQIDGEPAFFDGGEPFIIDLTPSAIAQRSQAIGAIIENTDTSTIRAAFSDGLNEIAVGTDEVDGQTVDIITIDGCVIEVFFSPDFGATGLPQLFVDPAMTVTLAIRADTPECQNHPFFGPLAATGRESNGYRLIDITGTYEEAFSSQSELALRVHLSVDPTDANADTRTIEFRILPDAV